jgi:hypothetical protein
MLVEFLARPSSRFARPDCHPRGEKIMPLPTKDTRERKDRLNPAPMESGDTRRRSGKRIVSRDRGASRVRDEAMHLN